MDSIALYVHNSWLCWRLAVGVLLIEDFLCGGPAGARAGGAVAGGG